MADFPTYQRQVSPQGALAAPQGTSVGEVIGAGLHNLGQGMSEAATDLAEADRINLERQLQADRQTTAGAYVELLGQQNQAYRAAADNAPPGAAGFQDQVLGNFDQAAAEARKSVPASQAGLWDEQVAALRNHLGDRAGQFQDASRDRYINDQVNATIGTAATNVANDPSTFALNQSTVLNAIAAMNATPEEKKALAKSANQSLQDARLNAVLRTNPQAALKQIASGAFDGVGADKLAFYSAQANSLIGARATQAQVAATQAAAQARAAMAIQLQSDAANARSNGGVITSGITGPEIIRTFAGTPDGEAMAASLIAQRNDAVLDGQLAPQVATQSPVEDDAMLKSVASAAASGDGAALDRLRRLGVAVAAKRQAFAGPAPADAAADYNPAIATSWSQVAQDPTAAGALQNALALTEDEQQRQGVPPAQRQPLPSGAAQDLVDWIKAQPADQQLGALLKLGDLPDKDQGRRVIAALSAVKDGLPIGADLVADLAASDPRKAARVWSELTTDTSRVTLPDGAQDALLQRLNAGLVGALTRQAAIHGDAAAGRQIGTVIRAADQCLKARAAAGVLRPDDIDAAAADVTGHYALLSQPGAAVYYPAAYETNAPGAVAAGLEQARRSLAAAIALQTGPGGLKPNGETITGPAVWTNLGQDLALVLPGTGCVLMTLTDDQAREIGLGIQAPAILDARDRKG